MKKIALISILWIAAIQGIKVVSNAPQYVNTGYGNTNMKNNGEYSVLKHFLRDEFILFDIGANRGDWTTIALQLSNPKNLYAFEPIPNAYNVLNKKYNPKNNVHCYNLAISNKNGNRTFYHYQKYERLSSFYQRPILEQQHHAKPKAIVVRAITVNSFCEENNIEYIDFMKIDTEGAEMDVLHGAEELLAENNIGIIQFEYGGTHPDAGITLKQVYEFFTKYNYTIFRMANNLLIKTPKWVQSLENQKYSNYLALSPQALELL